ncbi:MAG: putative solute:sodium symporter small subunit [Hyphomicrobiaceae bacterium]|jgi:putative solute:sodium symporter small subunit
MSSDSDPTAGQSAARSADSRTQEAHRAHWQCNMRLTLGLLAVWAIVGLGCGVLLADVLNEFRFLGFPLGFWFAQQGAIITFVVLILIYAVAMGRFDRKLKAELQQIAAEENAS